MIPVKQLGNCPTWWAAIDHSTSVQHLHSMGKVQKLNDWKFQEIRQSLLSFIVYNFVDLILQHDNAHSHSQPFIQLGGFSTSGLRTIRLPNFSLPLQQSARNLVQLSRKLARRLLRVEISRFLQAMGRKTVRTSGGSHKLINSKIFLTIK